MILSLHISDQYFYAFLVSPIVSLTKSGEKVSHFVENRVTIYMSETNEGDRLYKKQGSVCLSARVSQTKSVCLSRIYEEN